MSVYVATYLRFQVGLDTMFDQLHGKLGSLEDGKFHTLSQGLREEVERVSREGHRWEEYNVDQLVSVSVCAPTPFLRNTSRCLLSVCRDVCVCACLFVCVWQPPCLPQKYVQMSALDDKDVPSAEQWKSAVGFMTNTIKKQIRLAEEELLKLEGPTSFYDRWLRWKSQSQSEVGGCG